MKLSEIKPNPNNPRLIKDDKFNKLVQSIKDFPEMMALRPIIVDEQNVIQGGNMRFKALQSLGYKDMPDEWIKQGKELTAEQWREFVIKDNVGFGEWDWDTLANEWNVEDLTEWGVDLPEWGVDLHGLTDDEKYTQKIGAPIYEAKNTKPEISVLYNAEKYKDLISKIKKNDIPNDVKTFLKVAACRHIVFNYENIADYYAWSERQIQELMEESALIVIDFNKAIELGYVKLSEEAANLYSTDYGNEE